MQETVKDRLIRYLKMKPMSQKAFCEKIGASNTFINSMRRSVGHEKLFRIKQEFPDLSINWLLYGEGEMLNSQLPAVEAGGKQIPFFDVEFEGGYNVMVNDQTRTAASFINVPYETRATHACRITGRSMQPDIYSGDVILLQYIEDFSWLPLGDIYAIVTTNDMRTVKRLARSDNDDNYLLVPSNAEYQAQELPKRLIRNVFRVVGTIRMF